MINVLIDLLLLGAGFGLGFGWNRTPWAHKTHKATNYVVAEDHLRGEILPTVGSKALFKDGAKVKVLRVLHAGRVLWDVCSDREVATGPAVQIAPHDQHPYLEDGTWLDAKAFWKGVATLNGLNVVRESKL